MERNGDTDGAWRWSSRNGVSWASVRLARVAGTTGTRRESAAPNTLSLASEMLGGQSRSARS